MAKETRSRNWTFLVYPDSEKLDPHWRDTLSEMGLQVAISPLHDRDKNKDGTDKKPHFHCVLVFDSVKAREQVQEICRKIGTNEQCQRVLNLKGTMRYLCHMDDPQKAQYSRDDVQVIGGLDYDKSTMNDEDEDKNANGQIGNIIRIVYDKGLYNFAELAEYLLCEEPDLFTYLRKYAYFFGQYFKSKQFFTEKIVAKRKKIL